MAARFLLGPPGRTAFRRTKNFVSSETSLQWPIPNPAAMVAVGGVCVGVAPDQNFTYILALGDSEQVALDCVYGAFHTEGPELTYNHASPCSNPGRFGGGGPVGMPTWLVMVAGTDGDVRNPSYLASEVNFRSWSLGVRSVESGAGPLSPQSGRSIPLVSSIRESLQACAATPCRTDIDVLRLSLQ